MGRQDNDSLVEAMFGDLLVAIQALTRIASKSSIDHPVHIAADALDRIKVKLYADQGVSVCRRCKGYGILNPGMSRCFECDGTGRQTHGKDEARPQTDKHDPEGQ